MRTVSQVLDEVRDLIWGPQEVQSWKQRYQQGKMFCDFVGNDVAVSAVTALKLRRFVVRLQEADLKPASINKYLSVVSQMLTTAKEHGYIDGSPVIPWLKARSERVRVLTVFEENTLLSLMQSGDLFGTHTYWITLIMLNMGLRPSEVFSLTGGNLTLSHLEFTRSKGGKPARLPLVGKLKGWAKWVVLAPPVCPSEFLVFPIHRQAYKRRWDLIRDEMGLADDPDFVPYVLRHTCASRLAAKGVPLTTIKEWMGHASIQTTMRYVHLVPGALEDAAKVLEG